MKSKRQIILDQIKALFEAVKETLPNDDPYPFSFGRVSSGPLPLGDTKKQFSVGIVPGQETKTHLYPFLQCKLPVAIEFQRVRQKDEGEPGPLAEEMLTVAQRVMLTSKLGLPEIVIDVVETGNEIDIESFQDKAVAGVLYVDISYRHAHNDPRS